MPNEPKHRTSGPVDVVFGLPMKSACCYINYLVYSKLIQNQIYPQNLLILENIEALEG